MESAPTVHEEMEKRPSFAVAKIILWDELDGAMGDIAKGRGQESVSDELRKPQDLRPNQIP